MVSPDFHFSIMYIFVTKDYFMNEFIICMHVTLHNNKSYRSLNQLKSMSKMIFLHAVSSLA